MNVPDLFFSLLEKAKEWKIDEIVHKTPSKEFWQALVSVASNGSIGKLCIGSSEAGEGIWTAEQEDLCTLFKAAGSVALSYVECISDNEVKLLCSLLTSSPTWEVGRLELWAVTEATWSLLADAVKGGTLGKIIVSEDGMKVGGEENKAKVFQSIEKVSIKSNNPLHEKQVHFSCQVKQYY